MSASGLGAIICMAWTAWFYWHRRKPIIKAAQPVFLLTLSISATAMCLSTVLLLGEPTFISCQLKIWIPNVIFTLLFGCLLTKLYRVYQLFASKKALSLSKRRISAREASRFLFIFLIANCSILFVWSVLDPYAPQSVAVVVPQYDGGDIFVKECGTENRYIFPSIMAGSHVLLVLISLYYATKCREVSKKFAEKKEVTMSIYQSALLSVLTGIVVAPAAVPTETKVLVLSIAIFFGTVGCVTIFAYPKWKNGLETQITSDDLMLRSQRTFTSASASTPNARGPAVSTSDSFERKLTAASRNKSLSTHVEMEMVSPRSPKVFKT